MFIVECGAGAAVRRRVGWDAVSDKIDGRELGMLQVGSLVATGSSLATAPVGRGTAVPIVEALSFLSGPSAVDRNGQYLTRFSESIPMHVVATAMGESVATAFVGTSLASPLFGLVADLAGSYGASSLGLAGRTASGVVPHVLDRELQDFRESPGP